MPKLLTMLLSRARISRPRRRALLNEESGQSLIELAVVLPTFFLLMIGFINICSVMFGLCNLSYASRLADRYACLHSQSSLVPVTQATIDSLVQPYIYRFPTNTHTDTLSGSNAVGGTATVKVSVTYNLMLPFFTVPAISLSSTASGTIVQ